MGKWGHFDCIADATKFAEVATIAEAFRIADQWVRQNKRAALNMLDSKAKWKSDPASEKQLAMIEKACRRQGLQVPEGLTKGEASAMIGRMVSGFGQKNAPQVALSVFIALLFIPTVGVAVDFFQHRQNFTQITWAQSDRLGGNKIYTAPAVADILDFTTAKSVVVEDVSGDDDTLRPCNQAIKRQPLKLHAEFYGATGGYARKIHGFPLPFNSFGRIRGFSIFKIKNCFVADDGYGPGGHSSAIYKRKIDCPLCRLHIWRNYVEISSLRYVQSLVRYIGGTFNLVNLKLQLGNSITQVPVYTLSAPLELPSSRFYLVRRVYKLCSLLRAFSGNILHYLQGSPSRNRVSDSGNSNPSGQQQTSLGKWTRRPPRIPPLLSLGAGFGLLFYGVLNLFIYVCFYEPRKRILIETVSTSFGIVLLCHVAFSF